MMAGHPNNANPASLRRLPFIFMGGEDMRATATPWPETGAIACKTTGRPTPGYHRCTIVKDSGTGWMDATPKVCRGWH